jgi:hypothetical protein
VRPPQRLTVRTSGSRTQAVITAKKLRAKDGAISPEYLVLRIQKWPEAFAPAHMKNVLTH